MRNIAFPWTDDLLALAKREWLEGKSAQIIANMLGEPFTRSAVIGKAARGSWTRPADVVVVGVQGAVVPSQSVRARRARGELPPREPVVKAKVVAAYQAPSPPRIVAPPQPVVSLIHARPFMDRASRECAWMLDDGRSCCAAVTRGSYCAGHAAQVYRPVKTLDANKMARKFG